MGGFPDTTRVAELVVLHRRITTLTRALRDLVEALQVNIAAHYDHNDPDNVGAPDEWLAVLHALDAAQEALGEKEGGDDATR